ncbi:Dot/Icm T4SS effector Ceg17 [Legionella bozemanae]|uniref:Dot/Icm T4SS effector Ceg17 n=1 Tax=Legionella bozemanae TaxID=447 RepID=UPI00399D537F
MFQKQESIKGFTLKYTGVKFKDENGSVHGMEALRKNFSEMGALAIRLQLSLAQFSALIEPVCEESYEENSVEQTAEGKNQPDVFGLSKGGSTVSQDTKLLEKSSHYSIGKGKILNERNQALKYPNTEDLRGGESIWDTIHFSVWQTGISLSSKLSKQGFLYLCHPKGIDSQQYQLITQELENGEYDIITEHDKKIVKTYSGMVIETSSIPSNTKIDLDPEHTQTYQDNGFVINVNAQPAPMGWIIKESNKKLIKPEYAEDIIRVIRISKSGFRRLPEDQGKLLMLGLMKGNEHILHTQNRSFNAMDILLEILEKEYGFDPSQLMDSTVIKNVYKQMQTNAKEKDIVEDLLTLNLAFEMIQPLKATLAQSVRHPLLKHLTNSYPTNQNTLKAIIYAFDLQKKDDSPALYLDETPISTDEGLIDVRINGQLAAPDLTHPKNAAALLSIAVLVSEQMIIEQLLRDAVHYGEEHPNTRALKTILNDDELFLKLKEDASHLPSNEKGPILGLQFAYCEEIVAQIREKLGTNHLIEVIRQLDNTENDETPDVNSNLIIALKTLFNIGETLQQLEGTSGIKANSRGINGGLSLVIQKLAPLLYTQLSGTTPSVPILQTKSKIEKASSELEVMNACPFLSGKLGSKSVENSHMQKNHEVKKEQTAGSWCSFFTKVVVTTGVAAASIYLGSQMM